MRSHDRLFRVEIWADRVTGSVSVVRCWCRRSAGGCAVRDVASRAPGVPQQVAIDLGVSVDRPVAHVASNVEIDATMTGSWGWALSVPTRQLAGVGPSRCAIEEPPTPRDPRSSEPESVPRPSQIRRGYRVWYVPAPGPTPEGERHAVLAISPCLRDDLSLVPLVVVNGMSSVAVAQADGAVVNARGRPQFRRRLAA